jgi:hypothetical protein
VALAFILVLSGCRSRLITAGATVGIFTFFLVFLAFTPTAKELGQLIEQTQQNPQQPPPKQFGALQKRTAILGPLAVTLLLTAEIFIIKEKAKFLKIPCEIMPNVHRKNREGT